MIPDSLCSPKQSTALSHAITHVISMHTKKQTPLHSLGGSRVAKEACCRWALSFPEALLGVPCCSQAMPPFLSQLGPCPSGKELVQFQES